MICKCLRQLQQSDWMKYDHVGVCTCTCTCSINSEGVGRRRSGQQSQGPTP